MAVENDPQTGNYLKKKRKKKKKRVTALGLQSQFSVSLTRDLSQIFDDRLVYSFRNYFSVFFADNAAQLTRSIFTIQSDSKAGANRPPRFLQNLAAKHR